MDGKKQNESADMVSMRISSSTRLCWRQSAKLLKVMALSPGAQILTMRSTTLRFRKNWLSWHSARKPCPPDISPMQQDLLDKHYLCKHGTNTYYGQTEVTFLLFTSLCQRLKGKINFLIESVRKQNRREGNPLAILLSNRYWSILRSAYCRLAGEWRDSNQ